MKIWVSGLVQERRNSIALAMKLRLCCTNPSIWRIQLWSSKKIIRLWSSVNSIFLQPVTRGCILLHTIYIDKYHGMHYHVRCDMLFENKSIQFEMTICSILSDIIHCFLCVWFIVTLYDFDCGLKLSLWEANTVESLPDNTTYCVNRFIWVTMFVLSHCNMMILHFPGWSSRHWSSQCFREFTQTCKTNPISCALASAVRCHLFGGDLPNTLAWTHWTLGW